MEKEEKLMWFGTLVLIGMFIIFIIALVLLISLKKSGVECLIDPLKYAQKVNPKALCTCWQAGKP